MINLQEIQNYPQFDNFEFVARQIVEGFITGLHRSPFHGFSVEFAEHRLYNSGESTKHIDWKLFGRSDKLFVKRFEEETNLRCHIIIDTSSSMLFPFQEKNCANKLSFSLYSAASLIYLLRKQRDAVGLSLFSDSINFYSDAKVSKIHAQMLYDTLYKTFHNTTSESSFNKGTNIAQVLHQVSEAIHKRSLVILFSDFFENTTYEDIFAALQHLRYNKHEVIVFHVTEPIREEAFGFENRPLKITDMETGEILKILPNTVRESYSKNVQAIINKLELTCTQLQIDYVKADINKGFEQILLNYFIKRNKLL